MIWNSAKDGPEIDDSTSVSGEEVILCPGEAVIKQLLKQTVKKLRFSSVTTGSRAQIRQQFVIEFFSVHTREFPWIFFDIAHMDRAIGWIGIPQSRL